MSSGAWPHEPHRSTPRPPPATRARRAARAPQGAERRAHRRWPLNCPVALLDDQGELIARSRTDNLSDGGAYVVLPVEALPRAAGQQALRVQISVPRTTTNTYMLEDFQARATVVRTEPLVNADQAGLALAFQAPLSLDLDA